MTDPAALKWFPLLCVGWIALAVAVLIAFWKKRRGDCPKPFPPTIEFWEWLGKVLRRCETGPATFL